MAKLKNQWHVHEITQVAEYMFYSSGIRVTKDDIYLKLHEPKKGEEEMLEVFSIDEFKKLYEKVNKAMRKFNLEFNKT